jgi:sugar O-acyltransferase (sialic acid O-acetyltransferase NeuD family)
MTDALTVVVPLINPNEPEARLAGLHVSEGQQVEEGDMLCTLETTKSTTVVEAETAGFAIGFRYSEGDTVRAGDVLCYLAASRDWTPPQVDPVPFSKGATPDLQDAEIPNGLRITQPALSFAHKHGVDLTRLPRGPLITKQTLRDEVGETREPESHAVEQSFDPTAILVYGCGGHGKSLVELIRDLGTYNLVGFVDDGVKVGEKIMGLPVLGGVEALSRLRIQGVRLAVNAVGGIGNVDVRIKVFEHLAEAGFVCPAVRHSSAVIEPSVSLSPGVQVFPQAYLGSQAQVGFGCIVNTGAIISHDCVLGDFANISPGAILAGEVRIGNRVLIGMGATLNLQVNIGSGARIGNGATVKSDVPVDGLVRAGTIWPE